jgi:hypothetical protein
MLDIHYIDNRLYKAQHDSGCGVRDRRRKRRFYRFGGLAALRYLVARAAFKRLAPKLDRALDLSAAKSPVWKCFT